MEQPGLPKYWRLKESIRPVAQEFIEKKPEFEDSILEYCTEIDRNSPSSVWNRLRVIFDRLNAIDDLGAKKAYWKKTITKVAGKNTVTRRATIKAFNDRYFPFAMQYIAEKCKDGTIGYDQIFEGATWTNLSKGKFTAAMNRDFTMAHPAVAALKGTHGFVGKGVRLHNLLIKFRYQNPHMGKGLHLLVDAAHAIGENSAPLSDPRARCVLQFLFLPLSQLVTDLALGCMSSNSSALESAVPSSPPPARCLCCPSPRLA
jgi:hypothetical protein